MLLKKKLDSGNITQEGYNNCLRGAQEFYHSSLQYILKKMKMAETLWTHAVGVEEWRILAGCRIFRWKLQSVL